MVTVWGVILRGMLLTLARYNILIFLRRAPSYPGFGFQVSNLKVSLLSTGAFSAKAVSLFHIDS